MTDSQAATAAERCVKKEYTCDQITSLSSTLHRLLHVALEGGEEYYPIQASCEEALEIRSKSQKSILATKPIPSSPKSTQERLRALVPHALDIKLHKEPR